MEALLPPSIALPINSIKAKGFHLCCHKNGSPNKSSCPKRLLQGKRQGRIDQHYNDVDCTSMIPNLRRKEFSHVAEEHLLQIESKGFVPDNLTLSAMMLWYAKNGLFSQAQVIWDSMFTSSFIPPLSVVLELISVYATTGHFDTVTLILHEIRLKNSNMLPDVYAHAILCFGKKGQLELMEILLKEMISLGFSIDSVTGNAFVVYYSIFGSVAEMEVAYARLRSSQILIEEEAIRAISSAYIKERKFYSLGKFVEDVGLGRRNVGNLLWNLLLLSYAANFKMKSLQREFVRMVEAGFHPDLTTFNIRALAFSKMSLFWDLHLSLEHMKHDSVVPDLVTYGCVIDAYCDRRLGRNLNFALSKLNVSDSVVLSTDQIVFEVMGKGDFHSSSEAFLEFNGKKHWTYKELIEILLKKKFRSNQVFWNY